MRIILNLRVGDEPFLFPWIDQCRDYADKVYLVAKEEDNIHWKRYINSVENFKNYKIVKSISDEMLLDWTIVSDLDYFLLDSDWKKIDKKIKKYKDFSGNIKIHRTYDFYFDFKHYIKCKTRDLMPTSSFSICKHSIIPNETQVINHNMNGAHLFRYRFVGDQRVEKMLKENDWGHNYLESVWRNWIIRQDPFIAMNGNCGCPHLYARFHKNYKFDLRKVDYSFRVPESISNRLVFFNCKD